MPFILVVFCCCFNTIFAQQEHIQRAQKSYSSRQFVEASQSYEQAIIKEEKLALKDWLKLANCYRYQGKYVATINSYKTASRYKEFQQEWEHLYNYAATLKTLGNYKLAKKWLKKYKKGRSEEGKAALESLAFAKCNQKYKNISCQVKNEKKINSPSAEYNPMIFKDSILSFASSRSRQLPSKEWTKKNINFLYQASIKEDKTLKNIRLFQQRDSLFTSNPTPICYNRDYRYAISTFNHFVEGIRQISGTFLDKMGLEIFPVEDYGLHMMGVQMYLHEGKRYSSGFPTMGLNDTTLYFAANTPDGYGGFDIYKTTVIQDQEIFLITAPVNLGPEINTAGDEICPFMSADSVFYFVSDFHEGFGGYDIFLTTLEDKKWTKPQNLGQPINSPYDDFYYIHIPKKNSGYFTSNRPEGEGDYDIYSVEYK